MKLASKKLAILPEVVEKMMKPAEKIEGIRINNISVLVNQAAAKVLVRLKAQVLTTLLMGF